MQMNALMLAPHEHRPLGPAEQSVRSSSFVMASVIALAVWALGLASPVGGQQITPDQRLYQPGESQALDSCI